MTATKPTTDCQIWLQWRADARMHRRETSLSELRQWAQSASGFPRDTVAAAMTAVGDILYSTADDRGDVTLFNLPSHGSLCEVWIRTTLAEYLDIVERAIAGESLESIHAIL